MIIDMHTHAGRPNRVGPVDRNVLASMAPGGVAAAVVSAIADLPMILHMQEIMRIVDSDEQSLATRIEAALARLGGRAVVSRFTLWYTTRPALHLAVLLSRAPDAARPL